MANNTTVIGSKAAPSSAKLRELTLATPVAPMQYEGTLWKGKLSNIAATIEEVIAETKRISELIGVIFVAEYDRSSKNLTSATRCYALFDPNDGQNIWRLNSIRRGDMMVDVGQNSGVGGRFGVSPEFMKEMAPIVVDEAVISKGDRYFIKLEEYVDYDNLSHRVTNERHPILAIVELDLMSAFSCAFGVDSDYIRFSILSAVPENGDYVVEMCKFIDPNGARTINRHSGRIDHNAIAAGLRNYGSRGNNRRRDDNRNNGRQRSF